MTNLIKISSAAFFINLLTISLTHATPFYVGVDAGLSKYKDFCANPTTGFDCTDMGGTFVIKGGYQYTDNIAFELGYGGYGSPKTKGTYLGSALTVTEKISGLTLASKATFPLSKSFYWTAQAGIARTSMDVTSTITPGAYSASSTTLAYGFGIKYKFNRYYSAHIQYDNLGIVGDEYIGKDNLHTFTVGLSYNIGKPRPASATAPAASTENITFKPAAEIRPPIKVIVFLRQEAPQSKQPLTSAVSEACQCDANFVDMYTKKAPLYRIQLPPGHNFDAFQKTLLASDPGLGIKATMEGQ